MLNDDITPTFVLHFYNHHPEMQRKQKIANEYVKLSNNAAKKNVPRIDT